MEDSEATILPLQSIVLRGAGQSEPELLTGVLIVEQRSLRIRALIKNTAIKNVGIYIIGNVLRVIRAIYGKVVKLLSINYFARRQSLRNGEKRYLRGIIILASRAAKDAEKVIGLNYIHITLNLCRNIPNWFTKLLMVKRYASHVTLLFRNSIIERELSEING